ncbi:MAG: acyl-CoA/acyl-ACP dehydrogenase [Myxococcota bacterium]|nr:acyl-CoA/acyl-ACP dehydrogenase [Myxococcota bacterium]
MDVKFSEQQELLRESARAVLEQECPMSLVRAQLDDERGLPEALWKRMADLGWLGLIVSERYGGTGLGCVDLALLLEEMGRVLCPGPFLSTAVVGALAIEFGGTEAQREDLLPRLVGGDLRVALAQIESETNWEPEGIRMQAAATDGGLTLEGRKCFVADAPSADKILVAVRTRPRTDDPSEGISLVLVDARAPGVSIRTIAFAEQSRKLADVEFDGVQVPRHAVLGPEGEAWAVLERVHDHARVAVCAELVGSAQRVLELSVAYAKNREQFGQPIGKFQALQHKCADMLLLSEGIRSAAYYAAWALEEDQEDRHTAACLAKAYCSEAGVKVAADGIQIHGGLGFTWEEDLHLYFKHARAAELAFGSPNHQRELAARVLLDG